MPIAISAVTDTLEAWPLVVNWLTAFMAAELLICGFCQLGEHGCSGPFTLQGNVTLSVVQMTAQLRYTVLSNRKCTACTARVDARPPGLGVQPRRIALRCLLTGSSRLLLVSWSLA